MPDFFSDLNASGIGGIPASAEVKALPKINFNDLPTYSRTPTNVGASGIMTMSDNPFDMGFDAQSLNNKIAPNTADSRDLAKIKNSSVFKDLGYNEGESIEAQENRYDQAQPWWEATLVIKLGDLLREP